MTSEQKNIAWIAKSNKRNTDELNFIKLKNLTKNIIENN